MRLLHAASSVDPAQGGVVASILDRGRVLTRLGHRVEIVTADAPDAPCVRDCPLPATAVGPGSGRYARTAGMAPWIRKNAARFDAVVADGIWQHNLVAAHEGVAGHTPLFVFSHGMLDPWFKAAYPFKHLKKIPYWILATHPALAAARAVLFTCEEERDLARGQFWPYRIREAVSPLGVTVPVDAQGSGHAFSEAFPQTRGRAYLLFLSRIHPKKGCDLLLSAFARTAPPDLMLVMAGPDADGWRPSLEAQAAALGLSDRVVWTGMLTDGIKWGAYANAEAFILPSHQENFGVVVAEALACGKPALLTKKVNIWREVVEDGAGIAEDDTEAGIERLISAWKGMPPAGRSEMAERARTCFARRFEAERAALAFVETIGRLSAA